MVRIPPRTSMLARSVAPVKSSAMQPSRTGGEVILAFRKWRSRGNGSVVLDKGMNDAVEIGVMDKSQRAGVVSRKVTRPGIDDALNSRITFDTHALRNLVTRDTTQRRQHLFDGHRETG